MSTSLTTNTNPHPHLHPRHHPLPIAATLHAIPSSDLRSRTAANAATIARLEAALRHQRQQLSQLRRAASPSSPSPPSTPPVKPPTPASSPTNIMCNTFHSPSSPISTPSLSHREMAARGSHWSFAEKARFETALRNHGPFAWDHIIRAVGTRTEKQVKAYAARYRRRKKLAARMHSLPMHVDSDSPDHPSPGSTSLPVSSDTVSTPSATLSQPCAGLLDGDSAASDALIASPRRAPRAAQLRDRLLMDERLHTDSLPVQEQGQRQFDPDESLFPRPPLQVLPTEEKASPEEGNPISNLLDDTILGSTGDETGPMSRQPSEIDLLLDRAIEGPTIMEEESEEPVLKPLVVQLAEDPDPSDFLSVFFRH